MCNNPPQRGELLFSHVPHKMECLCHGFVEVFSTLQGWEVRNRRTIQSRP
ncbi:MAG: hypothetical protein LBL62_08335 [Planctomycetaceae bacterium]|nr:hypothetical protein [Planctomycetaceae bacterium]